MSSRISDLEKALAKTKDPDCLTKSSQWNESGTTTGQLKNALHPVEPSDDRSRGDIVVQKGSSSQYFNEILLSRVIDEEQGLESVLTPQPTCPKPSVPPAFNASGILSSPSVSISPSKFHPPNHLAAKLWNIFKEHVEACAGLKLLHIPTDEVKVFSVIANPSAASFEDLALCFAIYFASTVSVDPAETELVLGKGKDDALLEFKVGLEQALAHGDFLDRPTISGLHALAIYAAALRLQNRGKGIWILNGLAIRIAQSLGLHRDGKRLGLSPFQSEIRRRLWWHLLCRDSRAGEDYGLENTYSPLLMCDVELPANVYDTDLEPGMKEAPAARPGWTPMTFSLINIALGKAMQNLASLAASSTPSSPPSESVRIQILEEARLHAEQWLVHCNPVVPQQRLTLFCTRFLLRKLTFVTRLQWILLQQRAGINQDFATDDNLDEALEILGPNAYSEDGLLRQFSWTKRAYPQYHVTMYVLLHLCVKPECDQSERAWAAVNTFFADEMSVGDNVGFGPKLSVLTVLREKAEAIRNKVQTRKPAGHVGEGVRELDMDESLVDSNKASTGLEGTMASHEFELSSDIGEWPDWATLVQDFQLDASDVFLQ